jgi:hypothetical protein
VRLKMLVKRCARNTRIPTNAIVWATLSNVSDSINEPSRQLVLYLLHYGIGHVKLQVNA